MEMEFDITLAVGTQEIFVIYTQLYVPWQNTFLKVKKNMDKFLYFNFSSEIFKSNTFIVINYKGRSRGSEPVGTRRPNSFFFSVSKDAVWNQ
jgi:hypothetical protein